MHQNTLTEKGYETLISILLVDDHSIVRAGIRQLLESSDDFSVIAEAASGEEGSREFFRIRPDIMILDLMLPGESGLATLRRIHNRDETAKILVLSMYDDPAMLVRALDNGARGYLSKSAAHCELKNAVRAVAEGKPYIEQGLRERLNEQTLSEQHPSLVLTSREFEVFTMLANGLTVVKIAELLHLSAKTVGAHHTSIMKKMGLKNSAQLVRVAIMWGTIKL